MSKWLGVFFFQIFWPSQNILTLIKFVDWKVDSFLSSFPRNCPMHLIWKLLEGTMNIVKSNLLFDLDIFLSNESKNCSLDQTIYIFFFFNPCFKLCPSSKVVLKAQYEPTEDGSEGEGLSTYIEIFSPKKTGFPPLKNTSQTFFDFVLPLLYATF